MLKKFFLAVILITIPFFAEAAILTNTTNLLGEVKNLITGILIPLVFSLALLVFFWGMVKYIWGEGAGKDEGRKVMIWGIVALFVMSSVWGLVYLLRNELNIGDDSRIQIPTIGTPSMGNV